MTVKGMDIDGMAPIPGMFDSVGDNFTNEIMNIGNKFKAVAWEGDDKIRFHQEWDENTSRLVQLCVDTMTRFSANLLGQISQQREASGVAGNG